MTYIIIRFVSGLINLVQALHLLERLQINLIEFNESVKTCKYPFACYHIREFYSMKLICRNLYALFSHVKKPIQPIRISYSCFTRTLLAEPFLTVHMLCTEKRLCTNPVKFLLSMLSALLSNSFEPRLNRCSFPFAAVFTSGGLSFDHRFLPKIDACA